MENYLYTLRQFTCTLKLDFSLAVFGIKGKSCTLRPRELLAGSNKRLLTSQQNVKISFAITVNSHSPLRLKWFFTVTGSL